MAAEQFTNNAVSYLLHAISPSATVITVANEVPFPSVPQFRILIGSEIMLVTAVSGPDFTVTRGAEEDLNGGPAQAHSVGDLVEHVLTAGALMMFVQVA